MLRKFVKKLPIVNQSYKNYVLEREKKYANEQLASAVSLLEQTHLALLNVNDGKNSTEEQGYVISLTSYGERINSVHHTILSLLCQTSKPKQVDLWLAKEEFEQAKLPEPLLALTKYGLNIHFCEELRSYKKLVPALKKYPTLPIITFDDDVIYPLDQVEKLLQEAEKYPNAVICHFAHQLPDNLSDLANVSEYRTWKRGVSCEKPSNNIYPVGVGGVLYPVGAFDNDVLDIDVFSKICPYADDIWFKVLAMKNKTLAKVVETPRAYETYLHIPNTQDISLWQINTSQNDIQLKSVLSHYDLVAKK